MKNILVPTDFSDVSENAADYANELAKLVGAKIIYYYVFTVPVPVADTPVIAIAPEELEKESMNLLEKFDLRMKAKHGKVESEIRTRPGFVVDEIVDYAHKNDVELIVMGVTGAGSSPGVIGSNATAVMRQAKTPVVIIPHNYKFKKPETIALACDYKSALPDEAVEKFKGMVKLFDAKVLVFNVLKTHELATYQKAATEVSIENSLADVEHTLHFPAGDNLASEINAFVDSHKADVLAMFPHHYGFFKGLVHHSDSKEMAFRTHVPMISIHE